MKNALMIVLLFLATAGMSQNYIGIYGNTSGGVGLNYQHQSFYNDGVFNIATSYTGKRAILNMAGGYRFTPISSEIDLIGKWGAWVEYLGGFNKNDMGEGSNYDFSMGPVLNVLVEANPMFISLDIGAYWDLQETVDVYLGLTVGARISKRRRCEDR